jgi:polar amino acid transport system permease protein
MTTRGTGPADQPDPREPAGTPPPRAGRGSKMLGGRAVLVSSASTVLFFAVIAVVAVFAPGSEVVAERFFSPFHLWQSAVGTPSTPSVVGAFLLNVEIFAISEVLILILALVIAVVRQIPGPVFFPFRMVALAYTDLFRGVPLILVLYMIGFGVPGLGLGFVSYLPDVTYGIIALVLVYSAYVAEVYRAGIESVHESQNAAARSLGLTRWQSLRFVILPQAVRRVIPPLLNDFIGLQKDTGLVSVLGSIEAVRAAQIYSASQFNYASYVVAAFLFVLITIPLARFTDRLIARDKRRREAGAVA